MTISSTLSHSIFKVSRTWGWLMCVWMILYHIPSHAEGDVYKVLPHLLDLNGRHRDAPSLFARDAYQEFLRSHPDQVSGLSFDVLWKCPKGHKRILNLKIEIRGSNNYQTIPFSKVVPVQAKKTFKTWTSIILSKEELESIGKIVAWRVSLVEEGVELASQYSFLWRKPPDESPAQPGRRTNPVPGGRGFPRQFP